MERGEGTLVPCRCRCRYDGELVGINEPLDGKRSVLCVARCQLTEGSLEPRTHVQPNTLTLLQMNQHEHDIWHPAQKQPQQRATWLPSSNREAPDDQAPSS